MSEADRFPIAVALVCAGRQHRHWSDCKRLIESDSWIEYYVAKSLPKDPESGGVGHTETGLHPVTIKQVFRQDRFADLLVEMTESCVAHFMSHGPGGLVISCRKGNHRSDVTMRELAETLNELVCPSGKRLFNVQIFPLNQAQLKLAVSLNEIESL